MADDKNVEFETHAEESAQVSTATKARLDGSKLKELGWRARYDMKSGLERTIGILKE